jgi:hypothetical protein
MPIADSSSRGGAPRLIQRPSCQDLDRILRPICTWLDDHQALSRCTCGCFLNGILVNLDIYSTLLEWLIIRGESVAVRFVPSGCWCTQPALLWHGFLG